MIISYSVDFCLGDNCVDIRNVQNIQSISPHAVAYR